MERFVLFSFSNFEVSFGDGKTPSVQDLSSGIIRMNLNKSFDVDSNGFISKNNSTILIKKNGVDYPVKLVKTKAQHLIDNHFVNPQQILSNVVVENVTQQEFTDNKFLLGGSLTGLGSARILLFKFTDELIDNSYFVIEIFGYTDVLKNGNILSMYLNYHEAMSPDSDTTSNGYDEYNHGVFITNFCVVDSNSLELSETSQGYSFIGQHHRHNVVVPQGRPFQTQSLLSVTKNANNMYDLGLQDGYNLFSLGLFGQPYDLFSGYHIYTLMNVPSNKIDIETRISNQFVFAKIYANENVTAQDDLDAIDTYPVVYDKSGIFSDNDFKNGTKLLVPCISVIVPNGYLITDPNFSMHQGQIKKIKINIKHKA